MEHIQCLLCGISDGILNDIIKHVLTDNNINVYEYKEDCKNISDLIKEHVSYVIVGKGDKQFPLEYKKILNENNELIVVELLNNGKGLGLYMDDINQVILDKIMRLNGK